jgi:hypothetical protein
MKTFVEWGYRSTCLDLDTGWAFAVLPPGKELRDQYHRRPCGPLSRCGRRGDERNLALPGVEPGPYNVDGRMTNER